MKHLSKCGFSVQIGHRRQRKQEGPNLYDPANKGDLELDYSFGLGLSSINEFSVCYIYVDNWRFNLILGKIPPRICGMGAFSISITLADLQIE